MKSLGSFFCCVFLLLFYLFFRRGLLPLQTLKRLLLLTGRRQQEVRRLLLIRVLHVILVSTIDYLEEASGIKYLKSNVLCREIHLFQHFHPGILNELLSLLNSFMLSSKINVFYFPFLSQLNRVVLIIIEFL